MIFCFVFKAYGQAINNQPILVGVVYEHWGSPFGADIPEFALYHDGTVIFKKEVNDYENILLKAKLSQAAMDSLMNELQVFPEFTTLSKYYQLTETTCRDIYIITAWDKLKQYQVKIYGHPKIDRAPALFANIFEFMLNYDNVNAREWQPKKIEVLLSEFKKTKRKKDDWPDYFPDLNDNFSINRGNGEYSVYVSREYLNKLEKLKKKRIIRIDNRKYWIKLRFPFPNESLWKPLKK